MVYRHGTHPYLVTTHRKDLKQHKINYALFEGLVLQFLNGADWQKIAQSGQSTECLELLAKQEQIAREIDATEKVLHRYEQIIEDPNSTQFDRIQFKYRAGVEKAKKLQEERKILEANIASLNAGEQILYQTEGIDIYPVESHSKEGRLKLRLFLAERIERINLSFNVNVITDAPNIKGIEPGEYKIVAQIVFQNGANRWIFLNKDRAVLLS
jgi:hypothetical protein